MLIFVIGDWRYGIAPHPEDSSFNVIYRWHFEEDHPKQREIVPYIGY